MLHAAALPVPPANSTPACCAETTDQRLAGLKAVGSAEQVNLTGQLLPGCLLKELDEVLVLVAGGPGEAKLAGAVG